MIFHSYPILLTLQEIWFSAALPPALLHRSLVFACTRLIYQQTIYRLFTYFNAFSSSWIIVTCNENVFKSSRNCTEDYEAVSSASERNGNKSSVRVISFTFQGPYTRPTIPPLIVTSTKMYPRTSMRHLFPALWAELAWILEPAPLPPISAPTLSVKLLFSVQSTSWSLIKTNNQVCVSRSGKNGCVHKAVNADIQNFKYLFLRAQQCCECDLWYSISLLRITYFRVQTFKKLFCQIFFLGTV